MVKRGKDHATEPERYTPGGEPGPPWPVDGRWGAKDRGYVPAAIPLRPARAVINPGCSRGDSGAALNFPSSRDQSSVLGWIPTPAEKTPGLRSGTPTPESTGFQPGRFLELWPSYARRDTIVQTNDILQPRPASPSDRPRTAPVRESRVDGIIRVQGRGDYAPGRSDVDILVVQDHPPTEEQG